MSNIEVKLNPDVVPSGSDLAVVNAARRSFNSRSEWEVVVSHGDPIGYDKPEYVLSNKDKRLIHFLARGMTADDFKQVIYDLGGEGDHTRFAQMLWKWRNTPTHDTPVNHCFISFEVKAPIFVSRQLVKHEYLIMSEFSRRYITDGIEFYEPDYWRKAAENKKQGSLEEEIDQPEFNPNNLNPLLLHLYKTAVEDYGVAPEQARMVLPQSAMTEWTWSGTLGAFCKMCQLRLHPEAQYEARLVAQEIYKHLLEYYPVTAKAFVEGVD